MIHQVQTALEVDDRPNHEGILDHTLGVLTPIGPLTRKLQGALRTLLPKVDAVTQPVVIILALPEMRDFSPEDGFPNALVAPMEAGSGPMGGPVMMAPRVPPTPPGAVSPKRTSKGKPPPQKAKPDDNQPR